jgi:hypothetical protein
MIASVVAYDTIFRSWAESLLGAAWSNGALAVAGYASLAALLVGRGGARLIGATRPGRSTPMRHKSHAAS